MNVGRIEFGPTMVARPPLPESCPPKRLRTFCDVRLTINGEVFDISGLPEYDARRMRMAGHHVEAIDVAAEIVAERTVLA
jgi:hypothetical protein